MQDSEGGLVCGASLDAALAGRWLFSLYNLTDEAQVSVATSPAPPQPPNGPLKATCAQTWLGRPREGQVEAAWTQEPPHTGEQQD